MAAKEIYHIPDCFEPVELGETYITLYETGQASIKNKVRFTQNLICLLRQGHKEVFDQRCKVQFDNSSLLLMRAGNTLMTERLAGQEGYQSLLLFFSQDFLRDFVSSAELGSDAGLVTDHNLCLLRKDAYLKHFESSLLLLKEQQQASQTLYATKVTELLLYLLHSMPDQVAPFLHQCLQADRHHDFKQVIEQHLYSNLSNEELAFLCNMSLSTFKRKFTSIYGLSPRQYFLVQKMQLAAAWLKERKRPSDIYLELGYENLSSFSTEFKKHFGQAPSQFA